jgi:hypothetical protein
MSSDDFHGEGPRRREMFAARTLTPSPYSRSHVAEPIGVHMHFLYAVHLHVISIIPLDFLYPCKGTENLSPTQSSSQRKCAHLVAYFRDPSQRQSHQTLHLRSFLDLVCLLALDWINC